MKDKACLGRHEPYQKYIDDAAEMRKRIAELEDSIEINKRSYAGLYNDYLEQMNNVLSLEMDLAAMKTENERLRKSLAQCHSNALDMILSDCFDDPAYLAALRPILEKLNSAIDAAREGE